MQALTLFQLEDCTVIAEHGKYPTGAGMGLARRLLSPGLSSLLQEGGRRQPPVHHVRPLGAPGRDATIALSRDTRADQREGSLLPRQQSHPSLEHELHHGGLARFTQRLN